MSDRTDPRPITDYPVFTPLETRWMDNDIYGHVNNVVYYSFFDTAVNRFLIEGGALDIHEGEVIGLVVETGCRFFAPLAFPDRLHAGIGVSHIGRSSVRYDIGLFPGGLTGPAAEGHFVHVYVDRKTRRPTSLPERLRALLETVRLKD